jgi:hypothetical protein
MVAAGIENLLTTKRRKQEGKKAALDYSRCKGK